MVALKDVFKNNYDHVPEGKVGLEFEVEAKSKLPIVNSGTWNTVDDASLRGVAFEYVTRSPLPWVGVYNAIDKLLAKVNDREFDPTPSSRTSWHVHINALHETPTKFVTNLFVYWLLEPLLIMHTNKDRHQNTFCLQLADAATLAKELDEHFFLGLVRKPSQVKSDLGQTFKRYGAQNLMAFGKYGSIEYRAMDGTCDSARIKLWTDLIYQIWSTGNTFPTPDAVLDTYYDAGVLGVLERVYRGHPEIKAFHDKHISKQVKESIEANALTLLDIVEDVPYEWNEWERRIERGIYERSTKKPKAVKANTIRGDRFMLNFVNVEADENMVWVTNGATLPAGTTINAR